jgi:tetratricopeptide (TPR) repeat protein/DNA-binding SARP family transcriptional activator
VHTGLSQNSDRGWCGVVESGDGEPASFEIRLFGAVQAHHASRILDLGGTRARSVLAVLLLHPGQTVPKTRIVECAWRGDPPPTAEDLVAAYVSRLRKALIPAGDLIRLRSVRPGFRADLNPGLVDVHRFTTLLNLAGGDREGLEDDLAADHLRQALGLWHGNTIALADMESDWLRSQARVLEDRRLDALERLARIELDADRPDTAAALLQDTAPAHPEREGLTVTLVRALTALGESARAADLAARAGQTLIDLGQDPGPQLRRAQTAALARRPDQPTTPRGTRHQLPGDTSAFTGREQELSELLGLAVGAGPPSAVVIWALDGMAGIGKTALAIHAGHQLAERYPDGQMFLDLHGYTQGLTPREPADALATLLQAFGITPQQIPADPGARAALYRDRLAGTRTLLVLDNANSEAQVRPLLPGDGGCLLLVTSRKRLKALDDARALPLDVLPMPDAVALFRHVAGPDRTPPNDPLLEQIATLCGRLPLALRIAAALIRHRHTWTLTRLADKLRQARPDLTGFSDGDRNLTSVFNLSYEALGDDQRLLFRRLGLAPGPDTDAYAAAALLDSSLTQAEDLLQDLIDHNLLAEPAEGRYRPHDLIRAHAQTLAVRLDYKSDREAALGRLLHYYAHTAQTASISIARLPRPRPDGPVPAFAPAPRDPDAARAWLRTEYLNLEAAFSHARTHALDRHTIALAAGLGEILQSDGPFTRALEIHRTAAEVAEHQHQPGARAAALIDLGRVRFLTEDVLGAADALAQALEISRRIGNRLGEAAALNTLGRVRYATGDFPGATDALAQALEIYRQIGNRLGEAAALNTQGQVRFLTGDVLGAADALAQALEISRQIGNRLGEAAALNTLGRVRYATGDYPVAANALTQALKIYRQIGNRLGEAGALTNLGQVHFLSGDVLGAADALAQALEISRQIGNRLGEAAALNTLGRVRYATGNYPVAANALTQALKIYRQIGDHGDKAYALNHYAATITATGDHPRALALYHQALAMNRELHNPNGEAISLEGIAEHYLAAGDPIQGTTHLCQAIEIYRRLGMRADIERVTARLAGLITP